MKPKLIGNQFGFSYRDAGIISDLAALFQPDVHLSCITGTYHNTVAGLQQKRRMTDRKILAASHS